MEFDKLIIQRYSVRKYESKPVEDEKLQQVLNAANLAPTAANRQPFRMIVIYTEGKEEELLNIYNRSWFVSAPIIICACAVLDEAWTRSDGVNYGFVDTTIAMDHLILSAANAGLGTCWIAAFNPDNAKKYLNLPAGIEPVAFTPLGYPSDSPTPKKRKGASKIVISNGWQ